jgi:hypothetical protein
MGYGLNSFLDHDTPAQLLARLLIGSEGTLGFVAEAVLRTVAALLVEWRHPDPEALSAQPCKTEPTGNAPPVGSGSWPWPPTDHRYWPDQSSSGRAASECRQSGMSVSVIVFRMPGFWPRDDSAATRRA